MTFQIVPLFECFSKEILFWENYKVLSQFDNRIGMVFKLSSIILCPYGWTVVMVFYKALITNEWTDSWNCSRCASETLTKNKEKRTHYNNLNNFTRAVLFKMLIIYFKACHCLAPDHSIHWNCRVLMQEPAQCSKKY